MRDPDEALNGLVAELRWAESDEEVEALGRGELAGLLLHHAPTILDRVLKLARRDHRMANCLSAARYYSGLDKATCERIDAFLAAPFPGAEGPRAKPGKGGKRR